MRSFRLRLTRDSVLQTVCIHSRTGNNLPLALDHMLRVSPLL